MAPRAVASADATVQAQAETTLPAERAVAEQSGVAVRSFIDRGMRALAFVRGASHSPEATERVVCTALLCIGCAASAGPEPPTARLTAPAPQPKTSHPQAVPRGLADRARSAAPCAGPTCTPTERAPSKPERFPGTAFPPADIPPPFERSAQPGDGRWTRLGDLELGERAAVEPAVLYRTLIHPHPVSKWIRVTLVAIDLRYVALRYIPGTQDVKDVRADASDLPVAPGLVPQEDQDSLLAVFNGGFKPRHGNWGMRVKSRTLIQPREAGCTVALLDDGTVRIRSWRALSSAATSIVSYRQTPPCLLERGELHARLQAHDQRAWGGRDPKRKTRRRSALGVDASGRTLLYALGEEADPRHLARGLQSAGAASAAQLDINWSWTRFLVFGKPTPDGKLQVTSTLIPQMVHRPTSYVARHVGRDFFYVTRRAPE
jgi:hypothetical protein